ncbi:MAG: heme biosynthesis HemY N-terminal domain-containing protein [Pseudomonadota bacterium]
MLSALAALFRILLVTGALVWLARIPGDVVLEWKSYVLHVDTGFLLAALVTCLLMMLLLHRFLLEIAFFPKSWHWYRADRSVRNGLKLQAQALNALAADDPHSALRLATKAQKTLPKDYNTCNLAVRAIAAHQAGQIHTAYVTFQLLAQDKATRMLALRGQVHTLIAQNRLDAALSILSTLHSRFGTPPRWVPLTGFSLAVQSEDWHTAWTFLRGIERQKLRPLDSIRADQAALQMAIAELAAAKGDTRAQRDALYQAHKLDPFFVPAVISLARFYMGAGAPQKARPLIARAWVNAPHPDLVRQWDAIMPAKNLKTTLAHSNWRRQLAHYNPTSVETHVMMAEAALHDALWGEVRDHLVAADASSNTARVQALWTAFAAKAPKTMQADIPRRAHMPVSPDPVWYCRQTGRVYPAWMPLALPHRSFNTIVWGRPDAGRASPPAMSAALQFSQPLPGLY